MKAVAVLLVALAVYAQASDDMVAKQWSEFQAKFGKSYRSPVEANRRFAIFKENLAEIAAHNALFEQGEETYTKGVNQFADWTSEEFMEYVNKGLINKPTINGSVYQKSGKVLASSVDWRQKGAVTGVKDQGGCGSCWSFSSTGSIEGQLAIVRNNMVSLSEQNLMDCSWSQGNMGCNGGLMTSAFDYVKSAGIESEADYPYTESSSYRCKADSSRIVTKISSYQNIREGDESDLQDAIATRGPVSVAIDATNKLQLYSGGILNDRSCSSYSLNHGVLAVGYGSENGQDYYIVKNSWGASWGESGYFRLPRDNSNRCGISSMASVPTL